MAAGCLQGEWALEGLILNLDGDQCCGQWVECMDQDGGGSVNEGPGRSGLAVWCRRMETAEWPASARLALSKVPLCRRQGDRVTSVACL